MGFEPDGILAKDTRIKHPRDEENLGATAFASSQKNNVLGAFPNPTIP